MDIELLILVETVVRGTPVVLWSPVAHPGSSPRPSACEADVIATRPQVLRFKRAPIVWSPVHSKLWSPPKRNFGINHYYGLHQNHDFGSISTSISMLPNTRFALTNQSFAQHVLLTRFAQHVLLIRQRLPRWLVLGSWRLELERLMITPSFHICFQL